MDPKRAKEPKETLKRLKIYQSKVLEKTQTVDTVIFASETIGTLISLTPRNHIETNSFKRSLKCSREP